MAAEQEQNLEQQVAVLRREVHETRLGLELALRYSRALARAQGLLPQIAQVDDEVGGWLEHADERVGTGEETR